MIVWRQIAAPVSLLALWLAAGVARAELIEVRQVAGGMECAECARRLRMEVGRLDGVEATEASWNRRILTVRFRAQSHATLEEVRALVRRNHFSVREADVVVRGRVGRARSGALELTVSGSGAVYSIAAAAPAPGENDALTARLARAATGGRDITVRGRIAGDEPSPGVGAAAGADAPALWVLQITS
jgi:copper chaperone CopZ